jgi:hypothetical protein
MERNIRNENTHEPVSKYNRVYKNLTQASDCDLLAYNIDASKGRDGLAASIFRVEVSREEVYVGYIGKAEGSG